MANNLIVRPPEWPLPDEITLGILQKLPPQAILSFRVVCRYFAHLATDSDLWRSFCQRKFGIIPASDDPVFSIYLRAFKRKRSIEQGAFQTVLDDRPAKKAVRPKTEARSLDNNHLILDRDNRPPVIVGGDIQPIGYDGKIERVVKIYELNAHFFIYDAGGSVKINQRKKSPDGREYFTHVYTFTCRFKSFSKAACSDDRAIYASREGIIYAIPYRMDGAENMVFDPSVIIPGSYGVINNLKTVDDYLCIDSGNRLIVLKRGGNFERVATFPPGEWMHAFGRFYIRDLLDCYTCWIKENAIFRPFLSLTMRFDHVSTSQNYLIHESFLGIIVIRDKTIVHLPVIQTLQFLPGENIIRAISLCCNYLIIAIDRNGRSCLKFFIKDGDNPGFIPVPVKIFSFKNRIKSLHILGNRLVILFYNGDLQALDFEAQ